MIQGLELSPFHSQLWAEFQVFFQCRKQPLPPVPKDSFFVTAPEPIAFTRVIAGVGMYPTEANYCLVEHLGTNPSARLADRHRAVVLLASAVRLYCTARGKFPLMVIRSRSIGRILQRAGYVYYPGAVLSAPLGVKL